MRRFVKRLGTLALSLALLGGSCLGLGVPARAATSVNYDIYVNAKDNLGLNMRVAPGTEHAKVRENTIPMYTRLHITQEDTDSKGLLWGYTSYTENGHTDTGWVCLVETTTDPLGVAVDPAPSLEPQAPVLTPAPMVTSVPKTPAIQRNSRAVVAPESVPAEVAIAYAGAIDSVVAEDPDGAWRCLFLDVSGDGYPLLLTVRERTDEWKGYYEDIRVWEYKRGKAVEHDFQRDFPEAVDAYNYYIYETPEGSFFAATFAGGGAMPEYYGGQYYSVSQGRLTLEHTIKSDESSYGLDIFDYDAGRMDYTRMPWHVDGRPFSGDPFETLHFVYENVAGGFECGSIAWSTQYKLSDAADVAAALYSAHGDAAEEPDHAEAAGDEDRHAGGKSRKGIDELDEDYSAAVDAAQSHGSVVRYALIAVVCVLVAVGAAGGIVGFVLYKKKH